MLVHFNPEEFYVIFLIAVCPKGRGAQFPMPLFTIANDFCVADVVPQGRLTLLCRPWDAALPRGSARKWCWTGIAP